jgi:hypothetical protein
MFFARVQEELLVRYYRWALQQWDAELAGDLSTLRGACTLAGDQCIAFLRTLQPEARLLATRALTKRGHPQAIALLGEPPSPAEQRLLAQWDHFWVWNHPGKKKGMTLLSRRRAVAVIKERLGALGRLEAGGSFAEWHYTTEVQGHWQVRTDLDLGGRHGDLSYSQDLRVGDGQPVVRFVSFLAWLGISQTKWRIAAESDAEGAALHIARFARDFLDAVPALTSGLCVEA